MSAASNNPGPMNEMDGESNGGGTSANSSSQKPNINGSIDVQLTPELLFKMNKKIAQLTKVSIVIKMISNV